MRVNLNYIDIVIIDRAIQWLKEYYCDQVEDFNMEEVIDLEHRIEAEKNLRELRKKWIEDRENEHYFVD